MFNEYFKKILECNFDISNYNTHIIYFLCVIDFSILYFYFFNILSIIKNSAINKITGKDIEISQIDEKSLLNKYLDEILYFFEKNKFQIVVFQDLDRFKKIDIFTKLRQLNYFLNNYDGIKYKITFLYAIRPSILKDIEERTKFFDFILIKIPYINSHNSKEKLIQYFKEAKILINNDLLKYISLYTYNIRIINHIYNEFLFYRDTIHIHQDSELENTKLFALLVYKFFNVEEFSKLEKSEGDLYNILNSKSKYINLKKDKLLLELNKIKSHYIEEIFHTTKYSYIDIDDTRHSNSNSISDDSFIDIVENNKEIYAIDYYSNKVRVITSELNEKYKTEINKIKKAKDELSNTSIKDLYDYIDFKNIEKNNYADMIKYFIKQGYIDEDYKQYMSNFTYHNLTDNDREFVFSIKHRKENLGFDYDLSNIDEILDNLKLDDLTHNSMLNIQFFLHIIKNHKKYSREFNIFYKFLQNTNPLEFYKILLDKNCKDVINYMIENINDFWGVIENFKEKEKYLKDIIRMASKTNLNVIFENKNMQIYFSEIYSLSFIDLKDKEVSKNIIDIIKKFKIKFKKLSDNKIHFELYQYIIKNNSYEINIDLLKTLFFDKNENNKFDKKNYTFFKELENNEPFNYIKENLSEYIKNVFLKLENNINENEEIVIELINNNIDEVLKKEVIKKQECKFSSLDNINNKNLQNFIVEQNKLICNFKNINFLLDLGLDFNLIVNFYIQNSENMESDILIKCCELLLSSKNKNSKLIQFAYKKFQDKKNFNEDIIKYIIQNLDRLDQKITFLYKKIDHLSDQNILYILNDLGGEYASIALLDGRHTKIICKEYNQKLLDKLKERQLITNYECENGFYKIRKNKEK
ncbi:hypothetical protein LZB55_06000 [Campylobacter lari]|nr:hypothetical protein [Campylobacter lari]